MPIERRNKGKMEGENGGEKEIKEKIGGRKIEMIGEG